MYTTGFGIIIFILIYFAYQKKKKVKILILIKNSKTLKRYTYDSNYIKSTLNSLLTIYVRSPQEILSHVYTYIHIYIYIYHRNLHLLRINFDKIRETTCSIYTYRLQRTGDLQQVSGTAGCYILIFLIKHYSRLSSFTWYFMYTCH